MVEGVGRLQEQAGGAVCRHHTTGSVARRKGIYQGLQAWHTISHLHIFELLDVRKTRDKFIFSYQSASNKEQGGEPPARFYHVRVLIPEGVEKLQH